MRPSPTTHYDVHSDLAKEQVEEVRLRVDRMAEEYDRRTQGLVKRKRGRLPFYVFKERGGYAAAGGPAGSAGVFIRDPVNGSRLMAVYRGRETWHVIQHEGFHQFAHAVIGADLPVWVDEGLAEYFGHGIFTGDGFITGAVPPGRLARVREHIRQKRMHPFPVMMRMNLNQWNAAADPMNYDQAWSMVHFLVHGDGGRYQPGFTLFINDLGRRVAWDVAWKARFQGVAGFEDKWRAWWLGLPEDPTPGLYAQATVATLTSFLARAYVQKQQFKDVDEFVADARAKRLKAHAAHWLPPGLLESALEAMGERGMKWALEGDSNRPPRLVATLPDGTRVVGSFATPRRSVPEVQVEVRPAARHPGGRGGTRPRPEEGGPGAAARAVGRVTSRLTSPKAEPSRNEQNEGRVARG